MLLSRRLLPRSLPRRALARRDITIGRDGAHMGAMFCVMMVPQAEEWMIERFGKFAYIAQPGLNFAIPFVDSIAYKRSMKETTIPIHPQTAITKDNVHMRLDGAVYTRVCDAYKASYGIEAPEMMIAVPCDHPCDHPVAPQDQQGGVREQC